MRLRNLILGEFRFVFKYGIVALYIIFAVVYLCILAAIPQSARKVTASILILTDPAAMGLFFMGAVVLLEKSQRVESSLGVSPIKISEYIIAKLVPLMVIGTAVSCIMGLFAGLENLLLMMIGVAFSSILFSLCGLFVGAKIQTLNGFMIATVPFEILLCGPSILYLFGLLNSEFWILHPGVAALKLICGEVKLWYVTIPILLLWSIPAYLLCKKAVNQSFSKMGGMKL